MPTRGAMPGALLNNGYKSRFSHANESAAPGLYSVMLEVGCNRQSPRRRD